MAHVQQRREMVRWAGGVHALSRGLLEDLVGAYRHDVDDARRRKAEGPYLELEFIGQEAELKERCRRRCLVGRRLESHIS